MFTWWVSTESNEFVLGYHKVIAGMQWYALGCPRYAVQVPYAASPTQSVEPNLCVPSGDRLLSLMPAQEICFAPMLWPCCDHEILVSEHPHGQQTVLRAVLDTGFVSTRECTVGRILPTALQPLLLFRVFSFCGNRIRLQTSGKRHTSNTKHKHTVQKHTQALRFKQSPH